VLKAGKNASDSASLDLLGANPSPEIVGLDELAGKSNYFIGNNPAQWHIGIKTFARVRYKDIYPGIDLLYYGRQHHLEYDFVVSSDSDPRQIRFKIGGKGRVGLDPAGDLLLQTGDRQIQLRRPAIYQQIEQRRHEVSGAYRIQDDEVHFEIASYDHSKPLVIDPVLIYSTYLGGSGIDTATGIAVDSAGNAYVVGTTQSQDFPTVNPEQPALHGNPNVFVSKISADGSSLLYSTYIGGSSLELSPGIAVDTAGNVYIAGYTSSADFPTVNPIEAYKPGTCAPFETPPCGGYAFVAKLNASGSKLIYSTYLGFGGASGIAIDAAGNAYVGGVTSSPDFPTINPLQPNVGSGFVTKLNVSGSALVYSTFLDGAVSGIAVDPAGNAYITGQTTGFPLVNPLQSKFSGSFVAKINASGSALVYATYLGGTGPSNSGLAIAVDTGGNAYVTGVTDSSDFPTVNAIQPKYAGGLCDYQGPCSPSDAFVAKINATGSALIYSTYLGGSGDEAGRAIAVDSAGNAYVTGGTGSTNFPIANALQVEGGTITSVNTIFVTALNSSGSAFLYSTYLGNEGSAGDGIAVDAAGNVYVAGATSYGNPGGFPTVNALQPIYGGGPENTLNGDAVIAKIGPNNAAGAATAPSLLTFSSLADFPTIALTAAGSSPLTIANIAVTGDFAQTNNCGTTLPAGTTCYINVTFTPTAIGIRTGTVTITDNAPSASQSVKLMGVGTNVIIANRGVVDAASFTPGRASTCGSIGSIFGTNLASSTLFASGTPLPTNLGGTVVTLPLYLGRVEAPLFFVSPTQINFQIPWHCAGLPQVAVTVTANGVTSNPMTLGLDTETSPGIFSLNSQGNGPGAVLISNSATLAQPVGSVPGRDSRPAQPGEYISIFCTGLGQLAGITIPPPDGSATPSDKLYTAAFPVTVSIGGISAVPSFAGLAPGFVGLYQVDVQIPQNVMTGNAVPLSLLSFGKSSNTVTVAIQ
jgi:uncharacterized protein (TIGR03437 family)